MTVVLGLPSAEHVTITPGVPLSSTGRISDGRRVIGISSFHRRNETRPRTGARRLQIDLDDLELDRQRWRRDKRLQEMFGRIGVHRPETFHEAPADAVHDLGVAVLY